MDDTIKKQLEARSHVKNISTRLVEYFQESGKLDRSQVITELGLVLSAVILSRIVLNTYHAHSYVWLVLTAIILFVVILLCFKPITFAVSSYHNDRKTRDAAWDRVPKRLHMDVNRMAFQELGRRGELSKEQMSAIEGLRALAQLRGEGSLKGKNVALFSLYVVEHQDDLKTLGLFLLVLELFGRLPDLDTEDRECVHQARTLLASTFRESDLSEARKLVLTKSSALEGENADPTISDLARSLMGTLEGELKKQ